MMTETQITSTVHRRSYQINFPVIANKKGITSNSQQIPEHLLVAEKLWKMSHLQHFSFTEAADYFSRLYYCCSLLNSSAGN